MEEDLDTVEKEEKSVVKKIKAETAKDVNRAQKEEKVDEEKEKKEEEEKMEKATVDAKANIVGGPDSVKEHTAKEMVEEEHLKNLEAKKEKE